MGEFRNSGTHTHTRIEGGAAEEWGTWASRTQKRGEAGGGRPLSGGLWAAKTIKRPPQQPAQPWYANYWAPLTHKRHLPQPARPHYTNDGAPRTRKRHQQEHRPQQPTKRSDPTQHAKGRAGDCPGPRKETTTRRNVTQGKRWCQTGRAMAISLQWFFLPGLLAPSHAASEPSR